MSDWIDIERWPDCVGLQKPGIVFEIRNKEGLRLITPCVVPLPDAPFDWRSAPVEFRPIEEPRPVHSEPLPGPSRK